MEQLDDSIILQVAKFCDLTELNSMNKVNHQMYLLRLYRLFLGYNPKNNLGMDLIKNIKEFKDEYKYTLGDYLEDILYSLNLTNSKNLCSKSRPLIKGWYSEWRIITSYSLERTKKYWRNKDHKVKMRKVYLNPIYRIPHFHYKRYKKYYGYNLLALIY